MSQRNTSGISATGLRAVVAREAKRIVSRPIYWLIMLVLPLFCFLFFGTIFGGGTMRALPVAVYDRDGSQLSRKVVQQLAATAQVRPDVFVESLHDGQELLQRGEIYGLLVFPTNFQADVLRGDSPKVQLYHSNLNLGVGSTINNTIRTVVGTISAGGNLLKRTQKGETREQAMLSIRPITVQSHALYNPYTNYNFFLASSLLPIMFQMFVLATILFAVGGEFKAGTANEWLHTAGNSVFRALLGKLIPYIINFIILALFINSLLFDYLDMPLAGNRYVLDFSLVIMTLAYISIALTLAIGLANLRLSLSLGAGYGAMAFSFSGLAFPLVGMPNALQNFSNIFPFKFYLLSFLDQAQRAAPLSITGWHLLQLSIFLALPLLVARRARTVMTKETYWGKI